MIRSSQFNNWANEVNLVELYDDFNGDIETISKSFSAVKNFCQKEKKRSRNEIKKVRNLSYNY